MDTAPLLDYEAHALKQHRQQGRREGLQEGLQGSLELRFGSVLKSLMRIVCGIQGKACLSVLFKQTAIVFQ